MMKSTSNFPAQTPLQSEQPSIPLKVEDCSLLLLILLWGLSPAWVRLRCSLLFYDSFLASRKAKF